MAATIRPATERDLPACHEVWLSSEPNRLRDVPPPAAGTVLPLHEHELHTGRLLVAEDAGNVVAFGATLTRSGVVYLADLFVRPSQQGRGIGRALLHGLLDDAPPRRFTFASTHPAARPLYATFGMVERWSLHYLDASHDSLALDALDAEGVVAVAASVDDVIDLDRRVTGRDRRVDLEHERDRLGWRCFLLQRDGATIGYSVVVHPQWWVPWKPHGARVAPVMVGQPGDARGAVAATVRAALELGATDLSTFVPSEHAALPMLLAAGFVDDDDQDAYMASDPGLLDPERYLPPIDVP